MSFKQPPELHELQYDILGESLVDNPYLPPSPIPSKNKVLNTTKPFVTGAINELLQTITNIKNLVQTSLSQQQTVLGDFMANPSLVSDLQKIEMSVLKALLKLYKEMVGDINNPTDISGIAPSIKEAIIKLNDALVLEKRYACHKNEYLTTRPEPTHTFSLTYVPVENTIRLFVNGVEYDYAYDPKTQLLQWIFTEQNGGFDLTAGFKVKVMYDYLYSENI